VPAPLSAKAYAHYFGETEEIVSGGKHEALDIEGSTALPPLTVNVDDNPTPGSLFLSNFPFGDTSSAYGNYLLVLNEHGKVLNKRLVASHVSDYKRQPNGRITYFDNAKQRFYAMDSTLTVVDSFLAQNGCQTDGHDLLCFRDGGYMLMGLSSTFRDMSHSVQGGFNDAIILGNVIQEFDKNHNIIFDWRGIDHFDPLDAHFEDLTKTTIDLQHANSIALDTDGNIILSSRHLSEVTKIDRNTGEILWRFGGVHNQFTTINDGFDTIPFSYEHDARILPNGHLTLFDNGNHHAVPTSRALEFELDTASHVAKLVWQYRHSPDTYSVAMGNVERLASGNTLIGWGANSLTATEVRPNGETAFELSMGKGTTSYRVLKHEGGSPGVPVEAVRTTEARTNSSSLRVYASSTVGRLNYEISVGSTERVSLSVYDVLGHLRSLPIEEEVVSGVRSGMIDLSSLPSGVYYCMLRSSEGVTTVKCLLDR
jgi:hypothetical protein